MNRIHHFLCMGFLLVFMLFIGQLTAASYYVDGSQGLDTQPGTLANPWKTLQKANQTLLPGDTVYLRNGSYANQIIEPSRSGTSDASRITYAAYPGETVEIRDSAYGIYLYKKSYISITGMRFYNLRRFLRIYAGHYNIIGHCTFDQRSPDSGDWAGGRIANDFNDATANSEPSTHNRVHHCQFFRFVYGSFAEHRGCLLDIGNNEIATDRSSYNLIEDNTFAYGGHHTLGVYAPYNVIRRNYFHNETNPANWAYEGYRATITEGPSAGRCLYEGNRYGTTGASGMAVRSPRNIYRFNLFYHNGSGGLQVVSNTAGVDYADYNHIFHNTFYHNGYLVDYSGFQGGMYFANWSNQSPVGNVVKNNIFFDHKNGAITYDGNVDAQTVVNNWVQNAINPGFISLAGADPNDSSWPDLQLRSDSPARDQGAPLTIITSAAGMGTQFQVADALYFMDGWGVPGVQGDEIQLLGTLQRAKITAVNYDTQTLSLDGPLTWTQGQGINLSYAGPAPDLGAHEYIPALTITSPNGGEIWPRGHVRTITWNASNEITGNLVIELLQSNNLLGLIAEVPPSPGTFTWTVGRLANGTFITGSNLKVRISTAEKASRVEINLRSN